MRQIAAGMVFIALTACSDSTPLPAPSSTDAAAAIPTATTTTPAVDDNIVVEATPVAARRLATDLFRVMQNLDGIVDDASIMDDPTRYGRYFYSVINAPLVRWQTMADSAHGDLFGNLGYCREAGQALASLGHMAHTKGFAQQFMDERRGQYAEAVQKCQSAIKAISDS